MNNQIAGPSSVIDVTLAGLGRALQVRHITSFSFGYCTPEARVADVLENPELLGFDHIPVMEGDRCLGVLTRDSTAVQGRAQDHLTPLHDGILVAADMPILEFLPCMADARYQLVVDGTSIRGIVTRGDLLKLPVRVCVFTLITHLEMVMTEVIADLFNAREEWSALLSEGRRDSIENKIKKLKAEGLDPAPIECTDFCDKRDIIAKQLKGDNVLAGRDFTKDLKQIELLRNALAHAAAYAQDQQRLCDFVRDITSTQRWIQCLAEFRVAHGTDAIT